LITAWTRIEFASRFEHSPTNLPSKGRLMQVGAWISGGQGKQGVPSPVIRDLSAFAKVWDTWWSLLQPAWRKKDADGKWSTAGEYGESRREWGALYQWGVKGTLSVVAALYFWGCAAGEDVESEAVWNEAIVDVTWMLEGMAKYYEMFNHKF
ncbi:hypothetical protein B0H17DRAFT_940051, partial [Mycena rosella]